LSERPNLPNLPPRSFRASERLDWLVLLRSAYVHYLDKLLTLRDGRDPYSVHVMWSGERAKLGRPGQLKGGRKNCPGRLSYIYEGGGQPI
jgi:hypothetical protein